LTTVPRVLLVDIDGSTSHLVSVLADLHPTTDPSVAIVGGLAVLARTGTIYRVTADVDHVAAPGGAFLQRITAAGHAGTNVSIDGVKVDTIEVGDTAAELLDVSGLTEQQWRFAMAHQWALDTATPLHLEVVDARGRTTPAAVTVRVATSPALVAMKLQAARNRPEARRAKQASDYLDVYQIFAAASDREALGAALAAAPEPLGPWAADELVERFVTRPAPVLRALRQLRVPGVDAIGAGALAAVVPAGLTT
jgi:hypothetical protein